MRHVRQVSLGLIVVDRLPWGRVLDLVRHLEAGGTVPPVRLRPHVFGRFWMLDGRHRYVAHKLLGRSTILARYADVE